MSQPTQLKLQPKTQGQAEMLELMRTKDAVVATGPAGTGKTFVAAAFAAQLYLKGTHSIVLVRPNKACGPDLGYLPGDMHAKYEPWLRPFTSVLELFLGQETYGQGIQDGTIIFQPLSMIRGMSFNDSILLMDEVQNLTFHEIDALITRPGENTKAVLTGDTRQSDIRNSGLSDLKKLLNASTKLRNRIGTVEFGIEDIVRSGLCRDWVEETYKLCAGLGIK